MSKKKNNSKPKTTPKQPPKADSDYDVAQSMQRVRAYRPTRTSNPVRPATNSNVGAESRPYLNNRYDNHFTATSEPSRDLFIHLSERVSDINDKNELAHTDLRKEIDAKIGDVSKDVAEVKKAVDEKLSTTTFQWLLGIISAGIVLFVTIWFYLSYQPLLDKTESHSTQIHELDKKVNPTEHSNSPQSPSPANNGVK